MPGRTSVWCTTEFVGFHRWARAPKELAYLSVWHRHVFKVRVDVSVLTDDRDVEFHTLKVKVDEIIQRAVLPEMKIDAIDRIGYSCEQICKLIGHALCGLDIAVTCVSVSEDGECGAEVLF
jgi:hypothetical protein